MELTIHNNNNNNNNNNTRTIMATLLLAVRTGATVLEVQVARGPIHFTDPFPSFTFRKRKLLSDEF
jgi:hypothetical protein